MLRISLNYFFCDLLPLPHPKLLRCWTFYIGALILSFILFFFCYIFWGNFSTIPTFLQSISFLFFHIFLISKSSVIFYESILFYWHSFFIFWTQHIFLSLSVLKRTGFDSLLFFSLFHVSLSSKLLGVFNCFVSLFWFMAFTLEAFSNT